MESTEYKLSQFSIGTTSENAEGTTEENGRYKHRLCLPAPMYERNDVNVISILKQCIGKELSKITMPVALNEPLSFLQRMVEYLEYSNILIDASNSNDHIERLELVTAFAVSATSSNWERIGKPFNPLLGETYELDRSDLGFRIICEQVSHHPPVSAFHGEGEHFNIHGSIQPKMKFWGKSIEITPKGMITLHLKRHKETYCWHNVNCSVNNVLVGKMWIEHSGSMEVANVTTKHKCVLHFKSVDFLGRDAHKIEGHAYDANQKKLRTFYGKWLEALYSFEVGVYDAYLKTVRRSPSPFAMVKTPSEDIPSRGSSSNLNLTNQKLLWEARPRPQTSVQYYNFTEFALSLNELTPDMERILPPTDSRFRPDIRFLEEGDMGKLCVLPSVYKLFISINKLQLILINLFEEKAAQEKTRVEEKQRVSKKERKHLKDEWSPRWFKYTKDPLTSNEDWMFTGLYWKREYKDCGNIF